MTEVDAGRLSVSVVADLRGFATKLRDEVEKASKDVAATVKTDLQAGDLRSRLKEAVAEASAKQQAEVETDLQDASLRSKLAAAIRRAVTGQKAHIGADLDAKTLPAQARIARTEAQRSAGSVTLPVNLDIRRSVNDLFRTVRLLKLPAIAAAIGPVVGVVTALAGGLTALVSAAAPAVGVLGLLPGAIGVVAQAAVGAKIATSGLGDAFSQISRARQQLLSGQKLTEEQAKKLKASLDNVSPSARRFVEAIVAVQPAARQLRRAVQESFFAPFAGQVQKLAGAYLPMLRTALTGTAGILGKTVSGLGKLAASGPFKAQFGQVLRQNNQALTRLSGAVNPLVRGLVALLAASGPMVNRFSAMIARTATAASKFLVAGEASGRLQKFFARAYNTAAQLGRILGNLGKGLLGVGRAATPLGQALLNTAERLTKQFAAFTKTTAGQNKMKQFFAELRPTLTELGKLTGALAIELGKLGTDPSIAPLIAQLRTQLLPAVSNLLTNLNAAFGPALVAALTQVVNLFAQLAGAGGGGLTAFVNTITVFLQILNAIVANVPGASHALTLFFAAAGTAKAVKGIAGIIGGSAEAIKGVGTAALGSARSVTGFVSGLRGVESAAGPGASAAGRLGTAIRAGLSASLSTVGGAIRGVVSGIGSIAVSVGQAVVAFGRFVVSSAAATAAAVRNAAVAVATRTAAIAVAAATRAWAIAQFLLNTVMNANPLVRAAILIGLFVAAIIYAYNHSERFRAIVQAVWKAIQVAVAASVTAVRNVVVSTWNFLVGVFTAVWARIGGIVTTAWNVIRTVVTIYIKIVTTIITTYINIWRTIFTTGWNVIRAVITTAWNVIRTIVTTYIRIVTTVITTYINIWRTIITGAWNAIRAITTGAWNGIRGVISGAVTGVVNIVNGIRGRIERGWSATWSALSSAAGRIWSGIKRVFGSPVEFVVNTVIGGVVGATNRVLGWVKLPQVPVPHVAFKYASGGRVPGYGGGDKVPAMLERGEAIVPKHLVSEMAPWAASRGIPGFRKGGIIGRVAGKIASGARAAAGKLTNAADWVYDQGSHLLRSGAANALSATIKPLADQLGGMAARFGPVGEMMGSLGSSVVDGLVNFVRGKEAAADAPPPGGASPGGGVQRWASIALQALALAGQPSSWLPLLLQRMQRESGGNPRAINLWDSNAKAGVPSMGLMQTIGPTFNAYAGALRARGVWDPLANIYASIRYTLSRYGTLSAWGRPGGYASGAWEIMNDQLAMIHRGEMVVPAGLAEQIRDGVTPSAAAGLAGIRRGGLLPAGAAGANRQYNISIHAAPDVPTSQQLLRALSYAEALHA
jgi:hypothetical protein